MFFFILKENYKYWHAGPVFLPFNLPELPSTTHVLFDDEITRFILNINACTTRKVESQVPFFFLLRERVSVAYS